MDVVKKNHSWLFSFSQRKEYGCGLQMPEKQAKRTGRGTVVRTPHVFTPVGRVLNKTVVPVSFMACCYIRPRSC
jgi:hypothetical protein